MEDAYNAIYGAGFGYGLGGGYGGIGALLGGGAMMAGAGLNYIADAARSWGTSKGDKTTEVMLDDALKVDDKYQTLKSGLGKARSWLMDDGNQKKMKVAYESVKKYLSDPKVTRPITLPSTKIGTEDSRYVIGKETTLVKSGMRKYGLRRKRAVSSRRSGIRTGYRRGYRSRTCGTRKLARTTTGWAIDTEKKYWDRNLIFANWLRTDLKYIDPQELTATKNWGYKYTAGGTSATSGLAQRNLFVGITQGTTVSTRIGNRINVKYIKFSMIVEASMRTIDTDTTEWNGTHQDNNGELVTNTTENLDNTTRKVYQKTAYRIVLVKDTRYNNATNVVDWQEVFSSLNTGGIAGIAQPASCDNLNIENMGRFQILKDIRCVVDADDPMKTIAWTQTGVGPVRYNSGAGDALTNFGYYILLGCDIMDSFGKDPGFTVFGMRPGACRLSARICFTDS